MKWTLILSLIVGNYDNMKKVATKNTGGNKVCYLPTDPLPQIQIRIHHHPKPDPVRVLLNFSWNWRIAN